MNVLKKALTLVLVVMLMSVVMVSVGATGTPTVTVGSLTDIEPGASVTVPITLTNNPGIISFMMSVSYNSNLTLTGCAKTTQVFTAGADNSSKTYTNPYTIYIDHDVAESDYTNDGVIANLTFTVSSSAEPGSVLAITPSFTGLDGSTYNFDFEDVYFTPVAGGVTVKAAGPVEHTVTYNANGGTTAATTDTVADGSAADLTPTADKSGFTFLGWNTDASATTALSSYTVTADVTLYAIYEEIIPEALLTGVITRGASSVTANKAAGTIAVTYDTKQTVFTSSYVAFAPAVNDGVTVAYSDESGFFRTNAGITNYTTTSNLSGTPVAVDLASEVAATKAATSAATILKSNPGVYSFEMTLDDGVNQEVYDVTLTVGDAATEGNFITDGVVFKTFRSDDGVSIDTKAKEITLTTKTKYNYTTIAIKGSDFGPVEGRTRRVIEVLDAKDNSFGYVDFKGADAADYDRAILVNYGANRSYNIRIYGGEDGLSYEDYTLNVVYVASMDLTNIKLGNNRGLRNAKLNSAADCNENGRINVTYKTTGGMIRFSPVYAKGLKTAISGDEGLVDTVLETVAGAEREVYEIEDPTLVPSAMKYLLTRTRDTRTFDVNFIEG